MLQVVDDRWLWSYQKSEKTEPRFSEGEKEGLWVSLLE